MTPIRQRWTKTVKNEYRLKLLADRMAILMVEIIERDFDYGDMCFDDFYYGERADEMRRSKHYQVATDLIRSMIKQHDERAAHGKNKKSLDRSTGVPNEVGGAESRA